MGLSDFPRFNAFEREMPFTAKEVIKHYISEGKYTDKIYGGAATDKQVVFLELDEF